MESIWINPLDGKLDTCTQKPLATLYILLFRLLHVSWQELKQTNKQAKNKEMSLTSCWRWSNHRCTIWCNLSLTGHCFHWIINKKLQLVRVVRVVPSGMVTCLWDLCRAATNIQKANFLISPNFRTLTMVKFPSFSLILRPYIRTNLPLFENHLSSQIIISKVLVKINKNDAHHSLFIRQKVLTINKKISLIFPKSLMEFPDFPDFHDPLGSMSKKL